MSQAPMAIADVRPHDSTVRTVDREEEVRTLLRALEDADCRTILKATGEEALSANDIAEKFDLPTSTVYRKLERLADAGLIEERIRIHRSGRHVSEYCLCVRDVRFSVGGDGGAELEVTRREREQPRWSLAARTER
ncbi:helix-turn-helix domain-containing protein [Natronorarus salvus]|uniref:helix-turn-helix domain-containing protein n=1 Tax=Natronorarus salvus TaxID=3117733 RepID=UPI002F26379F